MMEYVEDQFALHIIAGELDSTGWPYPLGRRHFPDQALSVPRVVVGRHSPHTLQFNNKNTHKNVIYGWIDRWIDG